MSEIKIEDTWLPAKRPQYQWEVFEFDIPTNTKQVFISQLPKAAEIVKIGATIDYIEVGGGGLKGFQAGIITLIINDIRDRYVLPIFNDAYVYGTDLEHYDHGKKLDFLMIGKKQTGRKVKFIIRTFPNAFHGKLYKVSIHIQLKYLNKL